MSTGVLTSLVIVETIILALLALVVVSLLRSHAELLRRLPEPDDDHEHVHEASQRPLLSPDLPLR